MVHHLFYTCDVRQMARKQNKCENLSVVTGGYCDAVYHSSMGVILKTVDVIKLIATSTYRKISFLIYK